MDEIDLERVGGFQRLVALAQRALDIDRVGDVQERHQRRAVRQRHGDAIEHAAVAALQPALTGSRSSIAVTRRRAARCQSASSA